MVVAVFCLAAATEPEETFHLAPVTCPREPFTVVQLTETTRGILTDGDHSLDEFEEERGCDGSAKHFQYVRVGGSEGYCLRPVPEHDIDDLHALILARVNCLEFFTCG